MAYGEVTSVLKIETETLQLGLEHGCEVTGGSIGTGTAFGDLSGYSRL